MQIIRKDNMKYKTCLQPRSRMFNNHIIQMELLHCLQLHFKEMKPNKICK